MLQVIGDFSGYPVPIDKDILECHINSELDKVDFLPLEARIVEAEVRGLRKRS